MNAGMGVIHSERPPADIQQLGGVQELIQLWINTPAANKMEEPAYIPVSKEETPVVFSEDKLAEVQVVAGELFGVKGRLFRILPSICLPFVCRRERKLTSHFQIHTMHSFMY